jgi:hypothetical protein
MHRIEAQGKRQATSRQGAGDRRHTSGRPEQTAVMVRWQPIAVAAALAAPPVALAILVWPTDASAGGGGGSDGEIEASLAPGDSADGTVSGTLSADFEIVGDGSGPLVVRVAGGGLDSTLTLVDPESGDQLDYNDDTDGLDPALPVELDDGETVVAEVRSLGGEPGSFTISVDLDDGSDDDGDGAGRDGGGGVRVFPPGPATTIVVG